MRTETTARIVDEMVDVETSDTETSDTETIDDETIDDASVTAVNAAKTARALRPWMIEGDQWCSVETPYGRMVVAGDDDVVHHVLLPNAAEERRPVTDAEREGRPAAVAEAARQMKEYFAGDRRGFELQLDPRGTTFQRAVWFTLAEIPFGETVTYGEIAARVGKPTAYRAVGATNGLNPLALVLPCHRVIGSNGKLVGYGGGLELKEQLLEHERRVLAGTAPRP